MDVEDGARLGGDGVLRKQAREPSQLPVAVHRTVPVEAAVERGRQFARRPSVLVGLQDVRDLVRVFPFRAIESEAREGSRVLGREAGG